MKETNPTVRTAEDVVPGRAIAIIGIASIVVGVLAVIISTWLMNDTERRLGRSMAAPETPLDAPREIGLIDQTLIETDRFGPRLLDRQRSELGSYRWVDKDARRVQIPIERAMQIVIAEESAR